MKKLVLVLSVLTIVFAASAFAQNFDANNVGVYLADGSHSVYAIQGESLDLHMVVTNMDAPALAGFELKLVTDGDLIIVGSTVAYPTQAINVATRMNEYIVGFDAPVPAVDGAVEVMTFSAIVTDAAFPSGIRIEPVYFASISGVPSYLANADTGELVEMHQSTGGPNDQVFVVNNEVVPVATETTTFDSLKSLYR